MQAERESIAEYGARLRRLATDCNFGTFLPRALQDQFVSGIRDGNTKKKLLSQDISTFGDAMKTAIADEAAKRESQLFQTNLIHVVKTTSPNNHKKGANVEILMLPSVNSHLNPLKTKSHPTLASVVEKLDIQENTANAGTWYVVRAILI